MAPDDLPSLAGLRRRSVRKVVAAAGADLKQPAMPSLFDHLPADISSNDAVAEQPAVSPAPTPASKAPPPPKPQLTARVWTVAALVREVRGLVEQTLGRVVIEGEISNWRPAGSGHCYFTLKDGDAQLSVVMFRRHASLLRFKPKDGDAVRLRGQISVYENRGQMQLIAESMEQGGQGALLAAVQQLKERLRREGLFDRKRPLPPFPRCIGVVTSLRGAALRDIVKVCRRRHAGVNLLIYPAAVQGPRCPAEVIAGLRWFSRHPDRADVVIVARGGGSWEDLHGFDDEGVARAIAGCAVPVISGIGHATDTTIADAAADVCAPTPSAAAELVTAAHHQVEDRINRLRTRVRLAGRYEIMRCRQRFMALNADRILRNALDSVRRHEQHVDELDASAQATVRTAVRNRRQHLAMLEVRLQQQNVALKMLERKRRWEHLQTRLQSSGKSLTESGMLRTELQSSRLTALSPLRVLERGYALVFGPDGSLLRSADSVAEGQTVKARLANGTIAARIVNTSVSARPEKSSAT